MRAGERRIFGLYLVCDTQTKYDISEFYLRCFKKIIMAKYKSIFTDALYSTNQTGLSATWMKLQEIIQIKRKKVINATLADLNASKL